jgi:predicted DNA-binding transcriptional regulator AlpA
MVKDGRAPKPIRLSEGVSVWRIADIEEMLAKIEQQAAEVSQ